MSKLSVFLITMNEAHNIKRVLDSVSFADEIIIVDSGSTDDTLGIARKYTDKIYTHTDWQGYGPQKKLAQSYCTHDWVFSIDADEEVSSALKEEIQQVVASNDQSKAFSVPRLPWCFGKFLHHGGWYPAAKVRLYPREKAHYGEQRVHESLTWLEPLKITMLKSDMYHYTYRDMEHYLVKSAHFAAEWATQRQQQGKSASISKGVLHGVGCFVKIYILHAGFLDGKQGLLISLLSAHSTFVKYADLWSRSRQ